MSDTVKLGYSSSSNISFQGQIDTMIPREEWDEMSEKEQDEIIQESVNELVDIWVEDE
jgi:hypothetical protein